MYSDLGDHVEHHVSVCPYRAKVISRENICESSETRKIQISLVDEDTFIPFLIGDRLHVIPTISREDTVRLAAAIGLPLDASIPLSEE